MANDIPASFDDQALNQALHQVRAAQQLADLIAASATICAASCPA